MNERRFFVKGHDGEMLASNMSLVDALIFIKAYVREYYMEPANLSLCEHSRASEGEEEAG